MKQLFSILSFVILSTAIYAQQPTLKWADYVLYLTTPEDFCLDPSNNIISFGTISDTVDFDKSSNIYNVNAPLSFGASSMYVSKNDSNGNLKWAFAIESNNINHVIPKSVMTDKIGNIYILGSLKGIVDFDPSVGVTNLGVNTSNWGTFLAKYDSNGNLIWAKQFLLATSYKLCIDKLDRLHILLRGIFDCDPGPLVNTTTTSTSFVKLDTAGNFLNVKAFPNGILPKIFSFDKEDNYVFSGTFINSIDFDLSASNYILTTTDPYSPNYDNSELFIAKYDSAFNFVFAKQIRASPSSTTSVACKVNDFVFDENNNIYSVGDFNNINVDFNTDTAASAVTLLSRIGSNPSIFVHKLGPNGNFIWAKRFGQAASSRMTFRKPNELVLQGVFYKFTDFNPLDLGVDTTTPLGFEGDLFINCLDTAGNFKWFSVLKNKDYQYEHGVLTDSNNAIVFQGFCMNKPIDCDPSPTDSLMIPFGKFTIKLGNCDNTTAIDNTVTVSSTTLTANEANASSYRWIDCNNGNTEIPGEYYKTFTPTQGGKYAVRIRKDACKENSPCYDFIPLAVNTIKENKFKVYPNPSNQNITIDLKGNEPFVKIYLKDLQGKVITAKEIKNANTITLDISNQSVGMYMLEIATADWIKTVKILKD